MASEEKKQPQNAAKQAERMTAMPRAEAKRAEKKTRGEKLQPAAGALAMRGAVIRYVHLTEKAVRAIEPHNQLVFVVRRDAGKQDVRKAVEADFGERVSEIRMAIDQKGRKKAFVRFAKEGAAGELAIKLGII